MTWFLVIVLAIVALAAVLAVIVVASMLANETEAEAARIEFEVRRAERRLHEVASDAFQGMLDEARSHHETGLK